MLRGWTAVAVAAASLGLTACGAGSDADAGQIRQTIERFADSSGPVSCQYLTTVAKEELFIGLVQHTGPAAAERADAACRARSRSFRAARVVVTRVWFTSSHAAGAYAHRPDTQQSYQLALRKQGGRWRINLIQH